MVALEFAIGDFDEETNPVILLEKELNKDVENEDSINSHNNNDLNNSNENNINKSNNILNVVETNKIEKKETKNKIVVIN
jgi:hypothetical protein